MAEKGSDSGRSVFLVMAVLAVAGKLIPMAFGLEPAKVQTVLAVVLLPAALWYAVSLRPQKPSVPPQESKPD